MFLPEVETQAKWCSACAICTIGPSVFAIAALSALDEPDI